MVWVFLRPLGVIYYNRVLSEGHKNYFMDWCLMNSQSTFLFFDQVLTRWIIVILSNGRKSDNFESHNSVKLSLTNIHHLHSNFIECESFLESNCPDILAICETLAIYVKLEWLNWFWQYLCAGLSFLDTKEFCYSYFWSCSLCEGRTSFCTGPISKKILQVVTYVFD